MRSLRGRPAGDEGFTLIELMVVVLIIALLIAIAVPTFLGARRRAQDRQAQSHLRNGLVAEKIYYADRLQFTDSYPALQGIETNLDWGNPDATQRGVVVENVGSGGRGVVLKTLSKSGTLFCLIDTAEDFPYTGYAGVSQAGTYYAKINNSDGSTMCSTAPAWSMTTDTWSS